MPQESTRIPSHDRRNVFASLFRALRALSAAYTEGVHASACLRISAPGPPRPVADLPLLTSRCLKQTPVHTTLIRIDKKIKWNLLAG